MEQLLYNKESLLANLISFIQEAESFDKYWKKFEHILERSAEIPFGVHLAIFIEPYLSFILEGKKRVESRFSSNRIAPYKKIRPGDLIYLKYSGGPIVGFCEVIDVWFYRLDPSTWLNIRQEFTRELCIQDPNFWKEREHASYATLMKLGQVARINPIHISKHDRRGWIVLNPGETNKKLDDDY